MENLKFSFNGEWENLASSSIKDINAVGTVNLWLRQMILFALNVEENIGSRQEGEEDEKIYNKFL